MKVLWQTYRLQCLWSPHLLASCIFHPPPYRALSNRRLSTGLLSIPSKLLEVHPNDPAMIATMNFVKDNGRELLLYEALQSHRQFTPAPTGVALALFDDYSSIKQSLAIATLAALPRVDAQRWALEEAPDAKHCADEVAEDVIDMIESETFELPPELQTVMVEDNITWGDVSDAIQGSDFDMDGLDAMDYQNYLEDYDPDQDNVGLYIDNDRAWIDADKKECIVGARARLYEGFDVAKDTSENTSLQSEVWDPKPLDGASGLAPFLFLTQIPCSAPNADAKTASPLKTDEEFLRMFHRYGYLTSDDTLRRISLFRQTDTAFPRWLLVQEATDLRGYNYERKKREAEFWWRKNGWEGTVMEFLRLKEMHHNRDMRRRLYEPATRG